MVEDEADDKELSGKDSANVAVNDYDFRRPNRIPKEQKKTIALIHETYAQNLALSSSTMFNTEIDISLESVEQLTFDEYLKSLSSPTCILLFDMEPLNGYSLLEVNSVLMYSFIDKLMGGDGTVPSQKRSFTDLELAIVSKLANMFLKDLRHAWADIIPLEMHLKEIQSNPSFIRTFPMREICLVISLKAHIPGSSGLITICLPYVNIEPIASKLGNDQWHSRFSHKLPEEIRNIHLQNFKKMKLPVCALLGQTQLSMRDLLQLNPGDMISLEQRAKDPIKLRVAGEDKFFVSPGLIGKHKAVSVVKIIDKEKKNG